MEYILLKDVETLGKEGAVVHVKPGYARNFLLPRGLVLPNSPQNQRALEARTRRLAVKQERARKHAEALKQKLESRSLTMKLTLGEQDQPFGSVTVHDVVEALGGEGLAVDKAAVQLHEPLKALGIYEVPVRLHPEVTATLKIWVVKA